MSRDVHINLTHMYVLLSLLIVIHFDFNGNDKFILKLRLKLETVKVCGRWSKMAFWLEWQFDLGMATGHQVIDDMLNSNKQNNSSTVPNISKNKNISKFVDFCIFQMKKKIEKFKRHPSDVHCCQYIIYFVSSWIYDGNHTGRKPKTKWSRFRERFPWMTSPAKDSSHFRALLDGP